MQNLLIWIGGQYLVPRRSKSVLESHCRKSSFNTFYLGSVRYGYYPFFGTVII